VYEYKMLVSFTKDYRPYDSPFLSVREGGGGFYKIKKLIKNKPIILKCKLKKK
jgi:hypothetical protein